MDSISNLIDVLHDSSIYRSNLYIMSGSAAYLEIVNEIKKVSFELHNASDTTADKIVAILNTYIPADRGKLHISGEIELKK